MTKLHIDLSSGILDIEGEESFVKSIFDEFKNELAQRKNDVSFVPKGALADIKADEVLSARPTQSKSRAKKVENYTIVKSLDLSAKTNQIALKDFFSQKRPSTAMEKNVVFVYYLQHHAKVPKISLDHIFSCYKEVGSKVPALRQSIADTSSRRGWLDTASFDDIKLAIPGENYVEHDLGKDSGGTES